MKLSREFVEKPWGREQLPPPFPSSSEKKIGEVWFTCDLPTALLAKYLFTSERLSIQAHPNDEQAEARGLPGGKTECWYILSADEGATVGLGLTRTATKEELRNAALDGSIEQLVHWRQVSAGDFLFVPAGTVHAIGAGISLLEFQQNDGVTYRLFDYGRPRELHLDDGIAVSHGEPYPQHLASRVAPDSTTLLVDCRHFRLAHAIAADAPGMFADERRWVMPIEGEACVGVHCALPGECLLLEAGELLKVSGGRYLIGAQSRSSHGLGSQPQLSVVAQEPEDGSIADYDMLQIGSDLSHAA